MAHRVRELSRDIAAVRALLRERSLHLVTQEIVLAGALRDVSPCEKDAHSAVERVYEIPEEVRDVPVPELPEGASDEAVEWFHSLTK